MSSTAPASGALEVHLALRRGTTERKVTITLHTQRTAAHPEAASRVLDAFTCLVDAGRFHPARIQILRATADVDAGTGLFVESWEALFPRIPPDSFAVLARMIERSVRGARRLSIREQAPDFTLLVRRFEVEPDVTLLDVPWKIAFTAAPLPAVCVEFVDPLSAPAAERIGHAVNAWADVLALGGFSGAQGSACSTGALTAIEMRGDREMLAHLSHVACGYDAWEVLFEVLSVTADRTAATIARVEVKGRL